MQCTLTNDSRQANYAPLIDANGYEELEPGQIGLTTGSRVTFDASRTSDLTVTI
jgi:hypothetical protein